MFKFIDHTADIGLEAHAATPQKTLEEMAKGLAHLIFGKKKAQALVKKELNIEAENPVDLLVAFLNELIYYYETEQLAPQGVQIVSFDGTALRAIIVGQSIDSEYVVEQQVKAVTYHKACFCEDENGWCARVYIDV
ncbi:MAG: archease [Desulfuromonadales bacterium]|nr:archease [Desulfuromonadales bacterium]